MENLDVNAASWGIFMSVTLQATVHLGKDYSENLRSIRNQSMRSLKQLFQVTGKLITDQMEITSIPVIDWQQQMWQRTTLLTDKAVQFATANTYVFSDSVLCLGGSSPDPVRAWNDKTNWFMESCQFERIGSNRRGADGVRVEWNGKTRKPRQLYCEFF